MVRKKVVRKSYVAGDTLIATTGGAMITSSIAVARADEEWDGRRERPPAPAPHRRRGLTVPDCAVA
jgi:hypothetical protein